MEKTTRREVVLQHEFEKLGHKHSALIHQSTGRDDMYMVLRLGDNEKNIFTREDVIDYLKELYNFIGDVIYEVASLQPLTE